MKSQKLLEKLMQLDSVTEMKIYHISEGISSHVSNSVDWNEPNVKAGFNKFLKEMYLDNMNNLKSSRVDPLFL